MNATSDFRWWRSNRLWLIGAAVLGVLAFVWPYREALREYQRTDPSYPIDVAAGAWAPYEGARWRVVDAQWREAGPGTPFKAREDAAVVIVRYEVIIDKGLPTQKFDACKGRLSDAQGREWEANPGALSRYRSELPNTCGSYYERGNFDRIPAPNGRPFRFEHVFLVPKSQGLRGLHPQIRMPEPDKPGTYLRFDL